MHTQYDTSYMQAMNPKKKMQAMYNPSPSMWIFIFKINKWNSIVFVVPPKKKTHPQDK